MNAETVLFEGRVHVDHHQAYLESGSAEAGYDGAFAGQSNAMVGAGLRGALTLSTGTALGHVGLRVLLRQDAPGEPGVEWQEVAEVPFRPAGRHHRISDPLGTLSCRFELPVEDYRVRFCGRGIDDAWDLTVGVDDPLLDHYELVFWPETRSPDALLRSTSAHGIAVPPPEGFTVDETQPSAMDRFAQLDPDLARDVVAASPHVQRQVAYWAADRCCHEAGIADLELVAGALSALWADGPLPLRWSFEGLIASRLQDDGFAGAEVAAALRAVEAAVAEDPREAAGEALAALRVVVADTVRAEVFRAAALRIAELLADEDAASSADTRRFRPWRCTTPRPLPSAIARPDGRRCHCPPVTVAPGTSILGRWTYDSRASPPRFPTSWLAQGPWSPRGNGTPPSPWRGGACRPVG